jgi:hypothetical protein
MVRVISWIVLLPPEDTTPLVCRDFLQSKFNKLKKAPIKYREAVVVSSPGLPPRLTWVPSPNPPQPRWGCVYPIRRPNVAAGGQRWAEGHNRFAVSDSTGPVSILGPTRATYQKLF